MDYGNEKALPQINCDVHRRMSVRSTPGSSPTTAVSEKAPWMTSPQTSAPQTIILGLWPYATEQQTSYYTQGYKALYPMAQLLLLRYSSSYDERIGNALDVLTAREEKSSAQTTPNVLLHLFSGCGAAQACRLLRAYKIRTGRMLPVKAVVMDSAPKLAAPSVQSSTRSPRVLLAFLQMMIAVLYVRIVTTLNYWHFDRRCQQNRRDLHDPDLLPADSRKCYIFSDKDLMFSWHDGQGGIDDEWEREDITVKRSLIDSKGRWTGDQERYWLGIENMWDGR